MISNLESLNNNLKLFQTTSESIKQYHVKDCFFFCFVSVLNIPSTHGISGEIKTLLQKLAVKQKWVVLSGCNNSTTKMHVTPHAVREVHFTGKQEHVAN